MHGLCSHRGACTQAPTTRAARNGTAQARYSRGRPHLPCPRPHSEDVTTLGNRLKDADRLRIPEESPARRAARRAARARAHEGDDQQCRPYPIDQWRLTKPLHVSLTHERAAAARARGAATQPNHRSELQISGWTRVPPRIPEPAHTTGRPIDTAGLRPQRRTPPRRALAPHADRPEAHTHRAHARRAARRARRYTERASKIAYYFDPSSIGRSFPRPLVRGVGSGRRRVWTRTTTRTCPAPNRAPASADPACSSSPPRARSRPCSPGRPSGTS